MSGLAWGGGCPLDLPLNLNPPFPRGARAPGSIRTPQPPVTGAAAQACWNLKDRDAVQPARAFAAAVQGWFSVKDDARIRASFILSDLPFDRALVPPGVSIDSYLFLFIDYV